MFVCLENQINVHISQKNHLNSLEENKGLYNFIFMDYLELFVPLWDGFCSLMALGLF